ncbi:hypothetical protein Agub_g7719, partial [Astrephomene gubernaculifera]
LTGLRELDLRGCEGLTGCGLGALGGCSALGSLELDRCTALKCGLSLLWPLSGGLTRLLLGWCPGLGDAEVGALAGLSGLRELRLAAAQITDAGLSQLSPLTRLTRV